MTRQRSGGAYRAARQLAAALLLQLALTARAADAPPLGPQACEVCHGPGGVSADRAVPSLAGQPRQFIETQLVMFREGNRKSLVMAPLARTLTNADLNRLAKYFSSQAPGAPAAALAENAAAAARALAQKYFCVNCHGPTLHGQMHIPRLAGQQAEYLRAQLHGFKSTTRFDMDGQMTSVAQPLTAEEIDLLSNYFSTLP